MSSYTISSEEVYVRRAAKRLVCGDCSLSIELGAAWDNGRGVAALHQSRVCPRHGPIEHVIERKDGGHGCPSCGEAPLESVRTRGETTHPKPFGQPWSATSVRSVVELERRLNDLARLGFEVKWVLQRDGGYTVVASKP